MKVIQRNELIKMYTNKKKYIDIPILVIGPQKTHHYAKSIKKKSTIHYNKYNDIL